MADKRERQGSSGTMNVDTRLVRELAELLDETGLTEIEVEDGERRIRVARNGQGQPAPPMPPQVVGQVAHAPTPTSPTALAAAPGEPAPVDEMRALKCPMVGTAYLVPEPGAEPFVRKGDRVKAGDTLLIVEAMKVMNPITAPSDGVVEAILVENAQPVEFDQPLVMLA